MTARLSFNVVDGSSARPKDMAMGGIKAQASRCARRMSGPKSPEERTKIDRRRPGRAAARARACQVWEPMSTQFSCWSRQPYTSFQKQESLGHDSRSGQKIVAFRRGCPARPRVSLLVLRPKTQVQSQSLHRSPSVKDGALFDGRGLGGATKGRTARCRKNPTLITGR